LWQWDFGDPGSGALFNVSNLQNPTHIFSVPGTYFVKLKIYDNNLCTDSITKQIIIHPAPVADFQSADTCAGNITIFTDLSASSGSPLNFWQWDFGDGSGTTYTAFQANIPHLYALSGLYSVTLTVYDQNGCSNTKTQIVNVFPLPTAMFQERAVLLSNGTGILVTRDQEGTIFRLFKTRLILIQPPGCIMLHFVL
jgi:PKD repeat protein